jgi:hypothetical protein
MRLLTVLLLFAAGTLAAAEDATPPKTDGAGDGKAEPFVPDQLTITAGSGIDLSIRDRQPTVSKLSGGVSVLYDRLKIAADSFDFNQSPYQWGKSPEQVSAILDQGRISPGEKSPLPGRVLFDTREATSPRIGFRGLLTPVAAHIVRQPRDSATVGQARYQVLLHDLGEFSGQLHPKGGDDWIAYSGWADHADIDARIDVDEHGLVKKSWTVRTITLYGNDTRQAELRRLTEQGPPSPTVSGDDKEKLRAAVGVAFADQFVVTFDEHADADISAHGSPRFQGENPFALPTPTKGK